MNYIAYEVREHTDGTREWLLNGKRHREQGPAVECSNGDRYWYLNGMLHREQGPAVECSNGARFWYLNGKCHRDDGPAIEYADGKRVWFLNDEELTEQEFLQRTAPIKEMSIEQIQNILGYKIKITE